MKWDRINLYYKELLQDIYPQPNSDGHTQLTQQVVSDWLADLGCKTVLDIGAGQGFAQPIFEAAGMAYSGIALGVDVKKAREAGCNIKEMDFHFLDFPNDKFDLIFSRHSLEHSPMPVLALMEWHRVAKKYLCVVLPNPHQVSWACPNHYGVMTRVMAINLMERAQFRIIRDHKDDFEYWFLCEKMKPGDEYKEIPSLKQSEYYE